MSNEIRQTGSGQIAIQDVQSSTVSITQILGKSLEYKEMRNELETQCELFSYLPEDKAERRLAVSQKIAELEVRLEQFKKDVQQLATEFNRIEINTDRLRRAKEHFENGEIAAARAVFEAEREQMQDENDRLVREKARYETDILPKLQHNTDEFYLRALLEQTNYDNPRWLEDACDYFERSINAQATENNIFKYAVFLQNHNRFPAAEKYYLYFLNNFAGSNQAKRAMTLNNLANLHSNQNEWAQAAGEYMEALAIYRQLATVNPAAYLPDVALTLNNLAIWHRDQNEWEQAAAEYAEALAIQRQLAVVNPSAYLPYVGGTLNNLAVLHRAQNELAQAAAEYTEALAIQRQLAAVNPSAYLSNVGMALNNLANLHRTQNEWAQAAAEFAEALAIQRQLAAINPAAYLPDVALTLNNLANLHRDQNELAQAAAEYTEALAIRRQLTAVNPAAYLPDVALTLNNLAILHRDQNEWAQAAEEYAEALAIYRQLTAVNPAAYLPYVGGTLNNLAVLHRAQKELAQAAEEYAEALAIRRQLTAVNPAAYLPDVAVTLINLAIFHWQNVPNRELSLGYVVEAVRILLPRVEAVPYTQRYLQTAHAILREGWGLSQGEIEALLAKE